MTGIDRLTSISAPTALDGTRSLDAGTIARQTIGELGHRTLAWTAASGGDGRGAANWAQQVGGPSSFSPDAATLAQRGDVYGLNELTRDIGAQFGATPAQEGELHRALENFTRAAMVQVAGLSGADGARQVAGLTDALAAADETSGSGGVEDVIARLDAATASLSRTNGA